MDLYITIHVQYISYKEGRDQSSKESSQYAAKQAMKQTSNQANHQAVSFSTPSLQSTDMCILLQSPIFAPVFLISIRDVPPLSLDEPPNCMKIISSFPHYANTTKQKTNHLTILPTKKHRISTQKFRTKHGNFRVSFSSQPIGPDKLRLFRISWRSFTWAFRSLLTQKGWTKNHSTAGNMLKVGFVYLKTSISGWEEPPKMDENGGWYIIWYMISPYEVQIFGKGFVVEAFKHAIGCNWWKCFWCLER